MNTLESNPAYWRGRAEEARAMAECLQSPAARQHMLSAAASYDRLAELAERQPATATLKVANSN